MAGLDARPSPVSFARGCRTGVRDDRQALQADDGADARGRLRTGPMTSGGLQIGGTPAEESRHFATAGPSGRESARARRRMRVTSRLESLRNFHERAFGLFLPRSRPCPACIPFLLTGGPAGRGDFRFHVSYRGPAPRGRRDAGGCPRRTGARTVSAEGSWRNLAGRGRAHGVAPDSENREPAPVCPR